MNLRYLIIGLLFTSNSFLFAQTDCPCCTEEHNQFDFWQGSWNVHDPTGKKVGENLIEKIEDNCILSETWKGASGMNGRSYNYFNASDSTWNQLWIDNQGGQLILKGKAIEEGMVLSSELLKSKKDQWYRNRITWKKNEDGSVTQLWDILDQNDQKLTTVFEGIYTKRE